MNYSYAYILHMFIFVSTIKTKQTTTISKKAILMLLLVGAVCLLLQRKEEMLGTIRRS